MNLVDVFFNISMTLAAPKEPQKPIEPPPLTALQTFQLPSSSSLPQPQRLYLNVLSQIEGNNLAALKRIAFRRPAVFAQSYDLVAPSVMFHAIEKDRLEIALWLLSLKTTNVSVVDAFTQETILGFMIQKSDKDRRWIEAVDALLKRQDIERIINKPNLSGDTPFMSLFRLNNKMSTALLLDKFWANWAVRRLLDISHLNNQGERVDQLARRNGFGDLAYDILMQRIEKEKIEKEQRKERKRLREQQSSHFESTWPMYHERPYQLRSIPVYNVESEGDENHPVKMHRALSQSGLYTGTSGATCGFHALKNAYILTQMLQASEEDYAAREALLLNQEYADEHFASKKPWRQFIQEKREKAKQEYKGADVTHRDNRGEWLDDDDLGKLNDQFVHLKNFYVIDNLDVYVQLEQGKELHKDIKEKDGIFTFIMGTMRGIEGGVNAGHWFTVVLKKEGDKHAYHVTDSLPFSKSKGELVARLRHIVEAGEDKETH